ncbi:uncharacterized protein F5891DRAFT_1129641 [Suillus fuscotomentosus]|uniref:Uncharacterized protein n=1 Tax=Suillus fuscotomentosus TaxID=1912939 RepID=A0AAD4HHK9_9AGAM|nr:uncharacterized protein F5891DRAFT_1129641 [Suillus fuscotomentosus]KAG1897930.1 hypothetical protein F5891DRAFT_1129641 [Suillus fuscotomentosus]
MASHTPTPLPLSSLSAVPLVHSNLDTFKTEYHPKSGHATSIKTFPMFGCKQDQQLPIVEEEPWQPFSCRADFEFAELVHNAALNKDHTDALLQLIWRIVDGQANITFKSHHNDPLLAPHFVWDAQQVYKHDGTHYEHFYHEPWTGDHWWNVQSSLPENTVPFAFILYADKTHLSSAGIVKAYPVFAHCGNLPIHIRNTDRLGGGRMVGWLPIVPEDSEEDGKLSHVNLKCVVWHEGFFKLLETIILYAKTGYVHLCYDGIVRWLYAFILLLSADYEEQCVMVLIWRTNCCCPYTQACIELWNRDKTAGEEALKKWGLRPNVFWRLPTSNPHKTISQDHLHMYHIGEWGKHLFVTNITYSDGNKLRDISISKQILYTTQNVLMRMDDEAGYALLWCIASYLHIDMYVSLDVHTESTIKAGKAKVLEFQMHLEEYIAIVDETDPDATKNWNFPKMHASRHIFDDIIVKGAAHNFSTRPNEKQHGPSDIANQIIELDHKSFVAEFVCSCIDYLDEERRKLMLLQEELEEDDNDNEPFEAHLHIGLPLRNLTSLAQIHEHRYLKVQYESTTTWKLTTDYLRCNPSFHGHEHLITRVT